MKQNYNFTNKFKNENKINPSGYMEVSIDKEFASK